MISILRRLFGSKSRARRRSLLTRRIEVGIESLESRDLLSTVEITDLVLRDISGGEVDIYRSGAQETRQLNITLAGVGTDKAELTGLTYVPNPGNEPGYHVESRTSSIFFSPVSNPQTPSSPNLMGRFEVGIYPLEYIAEYAIGDLDDAVTWVTTRWFAKFDCVLQIDGTSTPMTILVIIEYKPLATGSKLDLQLFCDSPEALYPGGQNLELHRAFVYTTWSGEAKLYVEPRVLFPRNVVAVISHGFDPPGGTDAEFIAPFLNLARALEDLPAPGSILDGEIDTYVTRWDSTSYFFPGFVALLEEKILLAWSNLILDGDLESSLQKDRLLRLANSAHAAAALTQKASDNILEDKARSVANDLISQGLLSPSSQSNREQIIELIGHSRGAGLNLKIGQALWNEGYRNIEYIALDGYGSDWLDGGGVLSGIDIGLAIYSFRGRKLNYIAAQGLEWDPAVYEAVHPKGFPLLNDFVLAEVRATNDLRAPWRTSRRFENTVIPDTFHTTITDAYGDKEHHYLDQSYVGLHKDDGAVTAPLIAGPPFPGIQPETSGLADVQSAELPVASNRPLLDGFADGSFDELGALFVELQELNLLEFNEPSLNDFVRDFADPQQLVQLLWQTAGDVRISDDSGDPAIELRQVYDPNSTLGDISSIAQLVPLPDRAQSLEFDLDFSGASETNQLTVRYNGNELEEFYLYEIAESAHISIPLANVESQSGMFEFELWGWGPSSIVVRLDNFQVTATPNTAPVLTSSALELPDYATGGVYEGALVSTFLTGITDLDPNAKQGLAIVGVNPSLGAVQYTLDGGETWEDVGPVNDSLALLLAPHYDTRLRILTNGTIGSITDAVTFRAWDRSNGISAMSGEYFDASVTGGVTPISTATATIGVTVIDSDPPTANPGGPYTVKINRALPLDGSGSSDPEDAADQLIYQWDLDGDGIFGETGNAAWRGSEVGMRPSFNAAAFTTDTALTITLRVTDTSGLTAEASVSLNVVQNLSPTANPGGPYTVAAGGSVTLNGSRSRDSETAVNHLLYDWDLDGDGIFGETGAAATRGHELDFINPTFVATGLMAGTSFDIALRVTDGGGLTHTAGTAIQITDGIGDSNGEVTLQLAGTTPIWIKKHPSINILSEITVTADHLDGGVLWIGINSPGRKKTLDVLTTPAISSIGTSTGIRFENNLLELEIELGPNATAPSIEAFLRGLKFLTKGAGLNKSTRDVYVNLTNVDDDYDVITQKIQIQKKAPRSAIPRHARVR